ncbi:hypothetical protein ScalyP_jg11716 [Parmales sp. scaly parma]|nr:hypothetical protein ScalyP_jg11716 [Parmales sp. scaly parma]
MSSFKATSEARGSPCLFFGSPLSLSSIPNAGNEESFPIEPITSTGTVATVFNDVSFSHGSSLSLMNDVSQFFSKPRKKKDNFNQIDLSSDWEKWQKRLPSAQLYYSCLIQNPNSINGKRIKSIMCALRCVTDFDEKSNKRRVLIDYAFTEPTNRGHGFSSILIQAAMNLGKKMNANLYVLSLEDSAVYWMEKWNFVAVEDEGMKSRYNVFPDTMCMRLQTDPVEVGSKEDLQMAVVFSDDDDDDDGEDNVEIPAPFTSTLLEVANSFMINPNQNSNHDKNLCLSSISSLFSNAVQTTDPASKYRRIKMSNPAVQQRVFQKATKALDLLLAGGFEFSETEQDADGGLVLVYSGSTSKWLMEGVALVSSHVSI